MPPAKINLDFLRERLDQVGLTQAEFGRRMGMHESMTSRLMSGERRIALRELPALSRALELDYPALIAGLTGDAGFQDRGGDERQSSRPLFLVVRNMLQNLIAGGLLNLKPEEVEIFAGAMAMTALRARANNEAQIRDDVEKTVVNLLEWRLPREE